MPVHATKPEGMHFVSQKAASLTNRWGSDLREVTHVAVVGDLFKIPLAVEFSCWDASQSIVTIWF